ncbi:TPA: hypothetical protein ACXHA5_000649 [Legionella pneumophila]|nr:hypothetical protein [Legionella pneumophila]HAU3859493.1 hypothetical protein [Legionella pneumophila]HCX3297696.1 hypothetical protein [Legionella pneumophila]HDQ4272528.1 hypothetical protein [Legionella pneumophila]HDU8292641.1 hypothetical protein [Legionella pneumophila]
MKKLFAVIVIIMAFQTNLASAQPSSLARYRLYPIGDGTSVWLLNVETGALSRCISESVNLTPVCAPWAEPPGKNPVYRYDPKTKKFIPMNKAASDKNKGKEP